MQVSISLPKEFSLHSVEQRVLTLRQSIRPLLERYQDEFLTDISHISTAAVFDGGMQLEGVEHLKDNLYRLDYSYLWSIAWTCSGVQEGGRVKEKVRFSVEDDGMLSFKFLRFD